MAIVSIGNFSRMSFLSITTLRHYHEIGLLVPEGTDPSSGLSRYSTEQLPAAQIIVRLRTLGLPLDDIRRLFAGTDVEERNATIDARLRQLECQQRRTGDTVAALRLLLDGRAPSEPVTRRQVEGCWTLAITSQTTIGDVAEWTDDARQRLSAALQSTDLRRTGPDGSLYYDELFTEAGIGELADPTSAEIVAYLPVDRQPTSDQLEALQPDRGGFGEVVGRRLPGVELAIITHRGRSRDLDRSYARLGDYVTTRSIGAAGPIREHHLTPVGTPADRLITEVGWPIAPAGDPGTDDQNDQRSAADRGVGSVGAEEGPYGP